MTTRFTVEAGDVTRVSSDLLLLKYAEAFYGADQVVANILHAKQRCALGELTRLQHHECRIVDTEGVVAPARVMFLGTPGLATFDYDAMRHFATRAIQVLAERRLNVRLLTTTIHGVGYGLDASESMQSLVRGFQEGLRSAGPLPLAEIRFVERNERILRILQSALASVQSTPEPRTLVAMDDVQAPLDRPPEEASRPGSAAGRREPVRAVRGKRHVFVAMPFSEEFMDVYEFGIYNPTRQCGFICEKTDEASFTGDILQRIKERIETAWLVIADLTGARPNVYLEVGYAWGKGIPVVILAKEGEVLHFDVSRHRCIYYRSIRQLARDLERLLRGLLELEERE